jgi:hypothetical protein
MNIEIQGYSVMQLGRKAEGQDVSASVYLFRAQPEIRAKVRINTGKMIDQKPLPLFNE